MEAIKRILQHALNQLEERGQGFICSMIQDTSAIATPEERKETIKFFIANKPSKTRHKEFFKNKYFLDDYVWRSFNYADNPNELTRKEMFIDFNQERTRFLKYLISTI